VGLLAYDAPSAKGRPLFALNAEVLKCLEDGLGDPDAGVRREAQAGVASHFPREKAIALLRSRLVVEADGSVKASLRMSMVRLGDSAEFPAVASIALDEDGVCRDLRNAYTEASETGDEAKKKEIHERLSAASELRRDAIFALEGASPDRARAVLLKIGREDPVWGAEVESALNALDRKEKVGGPR
jgi:hypothetical protein